VQLPRAPMRLAVRREPFNDPDHIFELYDGFRAIARVAAGRAELISRRNNVYKSFALLCAELAAAFQREVVLDGEIVYLDTEGRPQFYELLRRRTPVCYVAFDLLRLDDRDLRGLPLIERKRQLEHIVPPGGRVLYASHIEGRGTDLFRLVCEQDLEGIVAKWKHGTYLDGTTKQTTWSKIRNPNYSQAEGRHELFERRAASVAGSSGSSAAPQFGQRSDVTGRPSISPLLVSSQPVIHP
jgi:bifunctional non-homologous end joining protein LigD